MKREPLTGTSTSAAAGRDDCDGAVREYYATGHARLSGTLISGKRDGVWTWWRADGTFIREVMYDNGTVLLAAIGRPIGRHVADTDHHGP